MFKILLFFLLSINSYADEEILLNKVFMGAKGYYIRLVPSDIEYLNILANNYYNNNLKDKEETIVAAFNGINIKDVDFYNESSNMEEKFFYIYYLKRLHLKLQKVIYYFYKRMF